MAGPLGIALGVVLPLVGMLASKLFTAADGTRALELASDNTSAAQSALAAAFGGTNRQLGVQNDLLRVNIALQAAQLRAKAREGDAAFGGALDDIRRQVSVLRAVDLNPRGGGNREYLRGVDNLRSVSRIFEAAQAGGDLATLLGMVERADYSGTNLNRDDLIAAIAGRAQAANDRSLAAQLDRAGASGVIPSNLSGDRGGGGAARRDRGGAAAARAERLNAADLRFAAQVEDRVQQINERWRAQPSLVRQARGAIDDLDDIIATAQTRLQRGGLGGQEAAALRERITQAQGAIQVVAEGLNQPFERLQAQGEQQITLLQLVRAGREDEAAALQQIYQLQEQVGVVTRDQREAVLANVVAERELNEAIARRGEIIGTYQRSIGDVRSDLEGLLSGQGNGNFFANLRRNFQQVQGRILTEQIFGPALRGLDEYVRQETSIQSSVDIMTAGTERAGNAANDFAEVLGRASAHIADIASQPGGGIASVAGVGGAAGGDDVSALGQIARSVALAADNVGQAAGAIAKASSGDASDRDIVVRGSVMALNPNVFFQRLVDDLLDPGLRALDHLLGTNFFIGLRGVLSGGIQGYMTAGPFGAVLGALGGIKGLPEGISKGLARALGGAQTGTQIAGIGKALGIKTSSTGGAIGGAIGGATGIPGMQIVGGILGSVVGGLLKKTPYGTAVVSGAGEAAVSGNKKSARAAAGSLAEAVQNGIAGIAEQLGGEVGDYLVSIGTYKDKVRVSGSGKQGKLKGGDVVDFGKDGGEAGVAYAIQNAIADGGIKGLSSAVQRALGSSKNIDKAVKEALKVQEVEVAIGGIGALAAKEFRAFEAQARERVRVARDYGFDLVAIEKYNAEQRAALTEKLLDAQVGSLKRLVDEMTSGSLFEGSALDRRTALLAQIEAARGDLTAGKEGAGDRLAELFEQLNSLSKEIYGTTGGFASDRASILDQATAAISKANERIAAASAASDPALATTNAALDENNDQNAQMIVQLGQLSEQIGTLVNLNMGMGNRLMQDRLSGLAMSSL